jgi:hypothetical protein
MESSMAYDAFSLNMTYEEDGGTGDAEVLQRATATDEEGYERLENYEIIDSVLKRLSGTDKYIFRQRFIEEKTQAEIAESVGRAPSYISNCIKRGYMQRPVMRLLETVHGIDVDRLCSVAEKPEAPQEAEPMTWDDLNMATAIEILLRIEKKLDAIIGKGA